jgi:hypothetical protein
VLNNKVVASAASSISNLGDYKESLIKYLNYWIRYEKIGGGT